MSNSNTKTAEAEPSLYTQLGGAPAIEAAVEAFYERVLPDPLLKSFFANTNMAWLKKSQVRFFAQALGGPADYKGRDMKSVHLRMAIEEKHFGRVAEHLQATLHALNVPPDLVGQVMAIAGSLAPEIINTRC